MNPKNYSNVILIPLRHAHHAKASGYSRIQDFISAKVIDTEVKWTLPWRLVVWVFRSIFQNSGSLWYHRKSFARELRAAIIWVFGKEQIFHFFYGENSFRYFGKLKKLGPRNYIICTYHTPPERFQEVVKDKEHLKSIDGLIVLSTMAIEYFSSLVGRENVYYVPRSVDIEYFKPSIKNKSNKTFSCLFVGNHLRDFETLINVSKLLLNQDRSIEITIITPSSFHEMFRGLDNLILLDKIDDSELLHSYQSAHILLLPLLDATANNVIVEAMACGLPIIATDLVGVRDYVTEECAILLPKSDAQAYVDAVLDLKNNKEKLKSMGVEAHNRAKEFSIKKIAEQTKLVYEKVALKSKRE